MRLSVLLAATALAVATPAMADHHGAISLEQVLSAETRASEAARDQYRHPVETLGFFGVEPSMTVVEYGPGGGWYTRVLAPYIAPAGTYMAMQSDSSAREYSDRASEVRAKGWAERFVETTTAQGGFAAGAISAFESDEIPEAVLGTVDRVLVFRSLHGLLNGNAADHELRAIRSLLADDGMVGVVQHRAPESTSYADSNGTRGYLRQSDVVSLFELNGFELVNSSEVNANPADPADWQGGVWSLPPIFGGAPEGSEERARRAAIGESDRMTLLFRKRP